MAYAYKFDCYNEIENPKIPKYDREYDNVRVWVVADSATEAEGIASKLISRDHYDLEAIHELAEDGHAIVD
jgi:hypothetical protein